MGHRMKKRTIRYFYTMRASASGFIWGEEFRSWFSSYIWIYFWPGTEITLIGPFSQILYHIIVTKTDLIARKMLFFVCVCVIIYDKRNVTILPCLDVMYVYRQIVTDKYFVFHIVSCSPSCRHGGRCRAPNQCICLTGWMGSICQSGTYYKIIYYII